MEAKRNKESEDENQNDIGDVIGDIKYKIDGVPGVEKVKIDWHDWDQIGSDLRRYYLKKFSLLDE